MSDMIEITLLGTAMILITYLIYLLHKKIDDISIKIDRMSRIEDKLNFCSNCDNLTKEPVRCLPGIPFSDRLCKPCYQKEAKEIQKRFSYQKEAKEIQKRFTENNLVEGQKGDSSLEI